jgi:hypothetical protein
MAATKRQNVNHRKNKLQPTMMNNSRRAFLQHATAGAVSIGIFGLSGSFLASCTSKSDLKKPLFTKEQLFGTGKVVTRRDIATMGDNDPTLLAFKEGVKILKARSQKNMTDVTGWAGFANLHALYCTLADFYKQVHYGWLVMPWHRGYLAFLEKMIQHAIADDTFALPYWDWTKYPKMPQHYFGDGNPLNEPTREALTSDVIPSDFINVSQIMYAPTFNSFGGYPRYDETLPQIEGLLEQSCHNNIHNWIGGHMARFPSSGLDALFSGHHGNVDRFWSAWLAFDKTHQNPADERWLNYSFSFYAPDGSNVLMDVKDFLNTEYLGYKFENLDFNIVRESEVKSSVPIPTTAEMKRDSTEKPLTIKTGEREKILAALDSGKDRVIMQFERLGFLSAPITIRVFIHCPALETKLDGRSYVGTFTILPIDNATRGGLDESVYIQMTVDKFVGELIRSGKPILVNMHPVDLRNRPAPKEPLQLAAITLKIDDQKQL